MEFGDLAGRLDARDAEPMAAEPMAAEPMAAEPAARVSRAVAYREEIERHVRQQVQAAAPFDCLCLEGAAVESMDLATNLSAVVGYFASRVPRSRTIFVAGYQMDLLGLGAFHEIWENVHALALYDWNSAGLQGRQFSSVINRLICRQAESVHSWIGRVSETRECW